MIGNKFKFYSNGSSLNKWAQHIIFTVIKNVQINRHIYTMKPVAAL